MTRVRTRSLVLLVVLILWTSGSTLQAQSVGPPTPPHIGFVPYAAFLGRPTTGSFPADSDSTVHHGDHAMDGAIAGGAALGFVGLLAGASFCHESGATTCWPS